MAKAGLLFVGTDDGLVLFSNPNNIGRWLRIGQPFRGQAVPAVWPHAENPLVVLAAVVGAGVQRSEDGGQSWQSALGREANALAGARSSLDRVYLGASDGGFYRSDDAGATWQAGSAGGWPASGELRLAVAAKDAETVYAGANDGSVWMSHDGGAEWAPLGDRLPAPVVAFAEAFGPQERLLALAGDGLYGWDSTAWQAIGLPAPAAGGLATLAGQVPVILASLAAGGVARSDDGGATWTSAQIEAPASAPVGVIAPASYHIDTAFAGDSAGQLLSSSDRGRSWQVVKPNLPPVRSVAAARLI